jgi:hypothetical protein
MARTTLDHIIVARGGEYITTTIEAALALVAEPGRAYAYFEHNGVIVTVDKDSTAASAYQDWHHRLGVLCEVAMRASATPDKQVAPNASPVK